MFKPFYCSKGWFSPQFFFYFFLVMMGSVPVIDAQVIQLDNQNGTLDFNPREFVCINNQLYFEGIDANGDEHLYSWNGSNNILIDSIDNSTGSGKNLQHLIAWNNKIYFSGDNGADGRELWVSDGTNSGTFQLKNINLNANAGSAPSNFSICNGKLYFSANDGVNGEELWETDGTMAGTIMVDNQNGASDFNPGELVCLNNMLLFEGIDANGDEHLYKLASGTIGLVDPIDGNTGSGKNLQNLFVWGNNIYFAGDNGTDGRELWISDGATANQLSNINASGESVPSDFTVCGGKLYFSADDGIDGRELWVINTAGGLPVKVNNRNGYLDFNPRELVCINSDTLLMEGIDSFGNEHLYRMASGSISLLHAIDSSPTSGTNLQSLIAFDNQVYFAGDNGANGRELWISDGTQAGTNELADIWPGINGSAPMPFFICNNKLFLQANNGTDGFELYELCLGPVIDSFTANTNEICTGDSAILTVSGTLNSATIWKLYADSCAKTLLDSNTSGTFTVNPVSTTTYFIRGEGGCTLNLGCASLTVKVDETPPLISNCPGNQTVFVDSNCQFILPDYMPLLTVTDNCGVDTVIQSPTAGTVFNKGAVITVNIIATDINGNNSTCSFIITVEGPVADFTSDVSAGCYPLPVSFTDQSSNANSWSWDFGDGITSTLQNPSHVYTSLGTFTVKLIIDMGNGCTDEKTSTITVQPPIAAFAANPLVGCSLPHTVFFTDQSTLPDTWFWDFGDGTSSTLQNPVHNYTTQGTFQVLLTVTDTIWGCSDTASTTVVVNLNVPPVAQCKDITVYLDNAGISTITGLDIDSGSTSLCGIQSYTAIPGTFDCDDLGLNSVMLLVTDVNGNTASCTSTVTVLDTIAPQASCRDITVYVDTNGLVSITPNDVDAGSYDNCAVDSISINKNSFDCNDIGVLSNDPVLWINEFHYDNTGTDSGEFIELAGTAGLNLSGYSLVLYNGANGMVYNSLSLSGIIDDESNGFGAVYFPYPVNGIQNGAPDGIALVDSPGNVLEFISYEGTFTAINGPATGRVSDNIGVIESSSTPIGYSLQRTGSGNGASAFNWTGPLTASPGDINAGQNILPVSGITVVLMVYDESGNTATCQSAITVLDTIPPTVLCQFAPHVILDSNGWAAVTVAGILDTAYDNCGIDTLFVTPDFVDCDDFGTVEITLTVVDVNGNVSSCISNLGVDDFIQPVAVCNDTTVYLNNTGQVWLPAVALDGGSTDNCPIVTWLSSKNVFTCSDIGQNPVTLKVFDQAQNQDVCIATVTVLDTSQPVISCKDLTVQLDTNGMAEITAFDVIAGSASVCGVDSIWIDSMTFDCNDIGANTVILTVKDNSGNVTTCQSIVTVEDNLPPTAVCKNVTVQLDANGLASITTMVVNDGSSDNCSIASMSVSPASFDCSNTGPNTVVLTVVDVNGNSDSCFSIVTISDTIPPTATCQNITVQLDSSGNASITTADVNNGSSDNCGIASMSVSPSVFDCSNTGANTVTLTVTDVNGNISTCQTIVTVVNNTNPVLSCPGNIVSGNDSSECGAIIIYSVTASGICNTNVTQTSGLPSGSLIPVGTTTNTFIATDSSGNTSSCSFTVTVNDTEPPKLNCKNVTRYVGPGKTGRIVRYKTPKATDNCDTSVSVQRLSGPPSGAWFPVGSTTITYQAWDAAGNITTCSFEVIVIEGFPAPKPKYNKPGDLINENENKTMMNLYPNPTNGEVNLNITKEGYQGKISIEVYNLLGRKVLDRVESMDSGYNVQFDLGKYAAGQYMIRIQIGDELLTRKLILVQ
jgi:ELWxxDGT repeat protein